MPTAEVLIGYPGEPDNRKIARESYNYALINGNQENDGIEESACLDPEIAYLFALNVLEGPSQLTREASCKSPIFAYWYALKVDKEFNPLTYEAASHDPACKILYDSQLKYE